MPRKHSPQPKKEDGNSNSNSRGNSPQPQTPRLSPRAVSPTTAKAANVTAAPTKTTLPDSFFKNVSPVPKQTPFTMADKIYNRLIHESTFNPKDFDVGYDDRFCGIMYMPILNFRNTGDEVTEIPWHRVYYFRYHGQTVWDRQCRIDLIGRLAEHLLAEEEETAGAEPKREGESNSAAAPLAAPAAKPKAIRNEDNNDDDDAPPQRYATAEYQDPTSLGCDDDENNNDDDDDKQSATPHSAVASFVNANDAKLVRAGKLQGPSKFFVPVGHNRVKERFSVDVQIGLANFTVAERNIPGMDDPVYERNLRTVWEHVPRGQSKVYVQGADGSLSLVCSLVGLRKFGYRESKYGFRSAVKSVICIDKENGECSHVAAFTHAGTDYWVAGSKHVHVLFRDSCCHEDLRNNFADAQRHRNARRVAFLFDDTLKKLSPEQRKRLHAGLAKNRWTASAEVILAESQHIVDYNGVNEMRFFALSTDTTTESGLAVDCDESKAFFEACGLHAVTRSKRLPFPSDAYNTELDAIARRTNSEGVVVYGMNEAGTVVCLWKEKSYPYVMERIAREAIKNGMVGTQLETYLLQRLKQQSGELRKYFASWEEERLPFLVGFAAWLHASGTFASNDAWGLSSQWLKLQGQCRALPDTERAAIAARLADQRNALASVQVIMFVGPPGCGKSTLSRALFGMLQHCGHHPRWLNQDEAGSRMGYLNAIKKAMADPSVTHILLDKVNLEVRNRKDYQELKLTPQVTAVFSHPDGPEAMAKVCVNRVVHRGAGHRTLRTDAKDAKDVAELVGKMIASFVPPTDPSCVDVDVTLGLPDMLQLIWNQMVVMSPTPLPAFSTLPATELLAKAGQYEALLKHFGLTPQLYACIEVLEPQEKVLSAIPSEALANKTPNTTFHVTTKFFGGEMDPIWFAEHAAKVGSEITLTVTDVVWDGKGVALKVAAGGFRCANPIPHITVGTAKDVAPVYSNQLLANGNYNTAAINLKLKGRFIFR